MPINAASVSGCSIKYTNEYQKTEAAHCTVGTAVIGSFLGGKCSDQNDSYCTCATEWSSELLGDHVYTSADGIVPNEGNGYHGVFCWNIECHKTNGKC